MEGLKSRQVDIQHVQAWSEGREPPLAFVVGRRRRRAANQRRRAEAYGGSGQDSALSVDDRADQTAGQALGHDDEW